MAAAWVGKDDARGLLCKLGSFGIDRNMWPWMHALLLTAESNAGAVGGLFFVIAEALVLRALCGRIRQSNADTIGLIMFVYAEFRRRIMLFDTDFNREQVVPYMCTGG